MNTKQINYPSTMPSEQGLGKNPGMDYHLTTAKKESESSKTKRQKLKKIQKKLILGFIFLLAVTAYFGTLAYSQKKEIGDLALKAKQLEKYTKVFKNKPLKIKNKSDSPYTIEQFEAVVLMESETKDSFYIKTFTDSPKRELRPGGVYTWEDIEEDINTVPGEALYVSMVFSRNNRSESTIDMLVLTDEKLTEHAPDFLKLTDDE